MHSLENTQILLEFVDINSGRLEIAEPTGFDACHFTLKQENGRYGRDVFFAEETIEFNPTVNIDGLTHRFEQIIDIYKTKGFEANVLFIVRIYETDYVIGQLDFATAETDLIKYFRCKIIQDTVQARLKRHLDTKVDLYSSEDVDGNPITPLTPTKVLLQSLPLTQVSIWEKPEQLNYSNIIISPNTPVSLAVTNQIIQAEIEDTISPSTQIRLTLGFEDFDFIRAQNTLTNVTLRIENGSWGTPLAEGGWRLYYRVGVDFNSAEQNSFALPSSATNYSNNFDLPSMERGEILWVWFGYVGGVGMTFSVYHAKITISTTSTSVSSLTDGIRLIDAARQVVRSISGKQVVAPRFEAGGEFYEQFIFKGNQLRLINDKPFTITFNEILKHIPEFNCDYHVLPDGNIFIGMEADYYQYLKIAEFNISPNSSFQETFNDRFSINKIEWKYKKFEQGDNGDEEQSIDGIHTESQYVLENKFVENVKKIDVEFIRDAFLLEKTRKQSIIISKNTAQSQDEDIFIIDTISGSKQMQETFLLRHAVKNEGQGFLYLFNDGSFNFQLLGFYVGQFISLLIYNEGVYTVNYVGQTEMLVTKINVPPTPDFNGIALTRLIWTPNATVRSRTTEGITSFSGTPHPLANMRFNIRKNLMRYYNSYLRTATMYYQPSSQIKNTFFRNGAEVYIAMPLQDSIANGKQNDIITVNGALGMRRLDAVIIQTEVLCTFEQFWNYMTLLRTQHGFCEVTDTENNIKRIYAKELKYNWKSQILEITGEKMN